MTQRKSQHMPAHQITRLGQGGLVSFLVTIILMGVVTLIVLGFTQLSIRNREDALDKQLSTQAFYAAEAGVNQAVSKIDEAVAANTLASMVAQDECDDPASPYGEAPILSVDPDVRVTCLLVDQQNDDIVVSASQGQNTVVPIRANGNLQTLTFAWRPASGSTPPADVATRCNNLFSDGAGGPVRFPATGSANCSYALLRVDLLDNVAAITSAQNAANATKTFYLTPKMRAAAPALTFSTAGTPAFVGERTTCNTTECRTTIAVSPARNNFVARISTFYLDAPTVTITGQLSSGSAAEFLGIFKIDATAKSQDVLRRIQVRYNPMSASNNSPFAALQTTNEICKRFTVFNDSLSNDCSP